MKKVYILLFVLFTVNCAFPQNCLPDGIPIISQNQIDSFQINYPNCTSIEGDLEIFGSDINNLNGLSCLTSIGGNVEIWGIEDLTSFDGLNNLTSIGGFFGIWILNGITDFSGLENLSSVGGGLEILENDSLSSLSGLEHLTSLGGYLYIDGNNALINCNGLQGITDILNFVEINSNNALIDLTGLNNLTSIFGDLLISYNNALINFTGLENLTTIYGSLKIWHNDTLASFAGLNNLVTIGGGLGLSYNKSLLDFTGLNNLSTIGLIFGGILHLTNNDALIGFTGLDNLTTILGQIGLSYNPVLTTLDALDGLTSIRSIYLYNNAALTSINGLQNIDEGLLTSIFISENSMLSTCNIQPICDYLLSPGGTVTINDNGSGCNSVDEVKLSCGIGINDNPGNNPDIIIFPNTASTYVNLQVPSTLLTGIISLSVYNVNSQIMKTQIITEPITLIDISGLSRGIYFAQIVTNNTVAVSKFIRQ